MQPDDNVVQRYSEIKTDILHQEHKYIHDETDRKIEEMSREAYLMRREIAIIASVFFLILIAITLFVVGSMTQVVLPV